MATTLPHLTFGSTGQIPPFFSILHGGSVHGGHSFVGSASAPSAFSCPMGATSRRPAGCVQNGRLLGASGDTTDLNANWNSQSFRGVRPMWRCTFSALTRRDVTSSVRERPSGSEMALDRNIRSDARILNWADPRIGPPEGVRNLVVDHRGNPPLPRCDADLSAPALITPTQTRSPDVAKPSCRRDPTVTRYRTNLERGGRQLLVETHFCHLHDSIH